jgi:hypothetical protein
MGAGNGETPKPTQISISKDQFLAWKRQKVSLYLFLLYMLIPSEYIDLKNPRFDISTQTHNL